MKDQNNLSPAAIAALARGDLDNFMVAATPGGIEAQEARGQKSFVASEMLPLRFNGCKRKDFEAMGIVFGKPIDECFQEAKLPHGWSKRATDHSMWSKLIDDKGRERADIFYKAAFYDRSAAISLVSRFSVRRDYDAKGQIIFHVTDCDARIFSTEPIPEPKDCPWELADKRGDIAVAWLAERFPDWKNPLAYWE